MTSKPTMASLVDEIFDDIQDAASSFVGDCTAKLNRLNPKDTGLSRSNWHFTRSENSRTMFAIDSPKAVSNRARKDAKKNVKINQWFYIKNNVEYIVPLLTGSSPQRAEGWMDQAIVYALNKNFGLK